MFLFHYKNVFGFSVNKAEARSIGSKHRELPASHSHRVKNPEEAGLHLDLPLLMNIWTCLFSDKLNLIQLMYSACVAAKNCRPVLHYCVVILSIRPKMPLCLRFLCRCLRGRIAFSFDKNSDIDDRIYVRYVTFFLYFF